MKFIPTVTEFEADMQEIKKLLYKVAAITYKYEKYVGDMTKEEYIAGALQDFNIESMKEEYELERNKES